MQTETLRGKLYRIQVFFIRDITVFLGKNGKRKVRLEIRDTIYVEKKKTFVKIVNLSCVTAPDTELYKDKIIVRPTLPIPQNWCNNISSCLAPDTYSP